MYMNIIVLSTYLDNNHDIHIFRYMNYLAPCKSSFETLSKSCDKCNKILSRVASEKVGLKSGGVK